MLKMQQPTPSVWPLDTTVVGLLEEAGLHREICRRQPAIEGRARCAFADLVRKELEQTDRRPVHVHTGMPIEASVEGGGLLPMYRVWPRSRCHEDRHDGS